MKSTSLSTYIFIDLTLVYEVPKGYQNDSNWFTVGFHRVWNLDYLPPVAQMLISSDSFLESIF